MSLVARKSGDEGGMAVFVGWLSALEHSFLVIGFRLACQEVVEGLICKQCNLRDQSSKESPLTTGATKGLSLSCVEAPHS